MVRLSLLIASLGFLATVPAQANSCADLVRKAEQGLVQQGLDDNSKIQLQLLLDVGRAGDDAVCQQATTGSLLTPRPAGHSCSKSEKTV